LTVLRETTRSAWQGFAQMVWKEYRTRCRF